VSGDDVVLAITSLQGPHLWGNSPISARGCLTNEETFRIVRVAHIARMITYQKSSTHAVATLISGDILSP